MKSPINLRVTPRVAKQLRSMLNNMSLKDPVIAIAQHRRDGSTEPHLGAGVYERADLPNEAMIVEVDHLKFYVDPSMESSLNDRTLDIVNGEITIV